MHVPYLLIGSYNPLRQLSCVILPPSRPIALSRLKWFSVRGSGTEGTRPSELYMSFHCRFVNRDQFRDDGDGVISRYLWLSTFRKHFPESITYVITNPNEQDDVYKCWMKTVTFLLYLQNSTGIGKLPARYFGTPNHIKHYKAS